MLTLITYPAHFGEPSGSPFCVKAMCLLNMSGADWQPEFTNDPRKAPKAKLPVLRAGERTIADSDAIREFLELETGTDFDAGLDPQQRATSRAVIRMVEEHLYFATVCDRWMNDENWAHVRQAFFSEIPAVLRGLITRQVRKQAVGAAKGQGMGRFSEAERLGRARKDIEAVQALLADKQFLFGDTPTAADASVVPALRAAACAPVATDLSRLVSGNAVLAAYLNRGRDALYPQVA